MNMTRSIRLLMFLLMTTIFSTTMTIPVYGQSYKEVTMSVGETKTFYLPSSVTSKNLKSVTFYSNGISYVQVTSYTNYSVTVKAIKAFSSPIIVRCDYRYFVRSGSYTYETSGAYDYRITVVGSGYGSLHCWSPAEKESYDDVHIGHFYENYPVFDSSDLCDDRTYQNYIFRSTPITEEDMKSAFKTFHGFNFCMVHEEIPQEMLPILYYRGDGKYMLLATAKS